jgi:hypothetical protein
LDTEVGDACQNAAAVSRAPYPVVITPPPSLGQIGGFFLGAGRQPSEDNVWTQHDDDFCLTPSFFEGDDRFGGWPGFDHDM